MKKFEMNQAELLKRILAFLAGIVVGLAISRFI